MVDQGYARALSPVTITKAVSITRLLVYHTYLDLSIKAADARRW